MHPPITDDPLLILDVLLDAMHISARLGGADGYAESNRLATTVHLTTTSRVLGRAEPSAFEVCFFSSAFKQQTRPTGEDLLFVFSFKVKWRFEVHER